MAHWEVHQIENLVDFPKRHAVFCALDLSFSWPKIATDISHEKWSQACSNKRWQQG